MSPANSASPARPPAAAPAQGTSGWEVADKVAHGVGSAANGVARVILILYGLGLIAFGLIVIVGGVMLGSAAGLFGLLFIAYGIYLMVPGWKIVIW